MSTKIVKKELKDRVGTFKTTTKLLNEAKSLGINVSATLHAALRGIVEKSKKKDKKNSGTAETDKS